MNSTSIIVNAVGRAAKRSGLALLLLLTPAACRADEAVKSQSLPLAQVAGKAAIVDDQTGEELARKHGIAPLSLDDFKRLLDAMAQAARTQTMELYHVPVDGNASDNPVTALQIKPREGIARPTAPNPGLPIAELTKKSAQYQKDRAAWQRSVRGYRDSMAARIAEFVTRTAAEQVRIAEAFDAELERRNGRDFPRSDIEGAILQAVAKLGGSDNSSRRVLVLNTDAVDNPADEKIRPRPFTADELPADITLLFVNKSRLPEKEKLFDGVKNPVLHADSLQEAMEMTARILQGQEPSAGEPVQPGQADSPSTATRQ